MVSNDFLALFNNLQSDLSYNCFTSSDPAVCGSSTVAHDQTICNNLQDGKCYIDGTAYSNGTTISGCYGCAFDEDPMAVSLLSNVSCSLGSCTNDMCENGVCTQGDSPTEGYCFVDGICYNNSDPNPNSTIPCLFCDTDYSGVSWSVIDGYCFIDGICLAQQDTSSSCMVCDPSRNKTGWSVNASYCYINEKCILQDESDSSNTCEVCLSFSNALIVRFVILKINSCGLIYVL